MERKEFLEFLPSDSGKYLIRSYSSGCFLGEIDYYDPENGVAKLKNSRRLRYWMVEERKGTTLAEIAVYGLNTEESKVCAVISEMLVSEIIELIPVSVDIAKKIDGVTPYHG